MGDGRSKHPVLENTAWEEESEAKSQENILKQCLFVEPRLGKLRLIGSCGPPANGSRTAI